MTDAIPAYLRAQKDGIYLSLKIQPRASKNEIGPPMGAELKIKVTAPPVDAAANEAVLELIAGSLECPRNAVQLVRGQTARHKTIRIIGMTLEQIRTRLSQILSS